MNASGVGTPSDTSEPVLVEAKPGELSPETGRRAPCVTGVRGWRGKGLGGWCPVRLLKELDGEMKRSRYSRPWALPGRAGEGTLGQCGRRTCTGGIGSIQRWRWSTSLLNFDQEVTTLVIFLVARRESPVDLTRDVLLRVEVRSLGSWGGVSCRRK